MPRQRTVPKKVYDLEYHRQSWTQLFLRLNLKYDTDILKKLDQVENKADYIRQLILNDIRMEEQNGK